MDSSPIPFLTADQMRQVDQVMIDGVGISLLQMMENAGRSLARLARDRFLEGDAGGKRVAILAGTGGNGGGALAAARTLRNWGATTEIYALPPRGEPSSAFGHQAKALRWDGAVLAAPESLAEATSPDPILDGIIGYSLTGPVRGTAAQMVAWANLQSAPILSLDVPSGLNATTGLCGGPVVGATATLTLGLPKAGFALPEARGYVGELYLADLGVPPSVYARINPPVSPGLRFAAVDIVRPW
jgi:NAD(P)H-hydrate epimerase